ncbi:MBL fold metallo-hydrolase [Bellilinea sp.]|uniref:MBL fold metallo-hydrolase n=1 Tax=Bellilinea sp. TaxID=2838785 RepID=UPI002ADE04FF|nr:MBL fold metallo-hydrolase [Bellilinea sp.]
MRIHFNGAAQTVTGSQYLLEVNGDRLLLECGLFQGHRKDTYQTNLHFPFEPDSLNAVILSHAHIDHSGNLPNLIKQGFEGKVYATPATADLADVMLQDSGHIQQADAEFVNRKRAKRGAPPISPLYTQADAAEVASHLKGIPYTQTFEPIRGVQARFEDAGHILGSAAIVLDIEEKGRHFRLWFSGDIGRERLPLMHDPVLPQQADLLIMECTYGDKPHRDPEEAYIELRDTIRRTVARKGKIIIPAFAVGRTQELVYCLNRMVSEGDIDPLPVFVDSPLAVNATRVFQKHADLFDAETQEFVRNGTHPALSFPQLTYIQSVEESKALNERQEPMIIISASGMAENGRILHHLRNNLQNPRNTVLIVSWQAPNTLGRRLAEREPVVRIFGELCERRAEVVTIGGFSAHAGQNLLVKYAQASQTFIQKLFLVHGEANAATALTARLKDTGFKDIYYPPKGSFFEV